MPMYEKLKIPASSMVITKEMIEIVNFDLVPTDSIDDYVWYFPEVSAFSLNFETAGVESILALQNAGFILYLILGSMMFALLHVLIYPYRDSLNFC